MQKKSINEIQKKYDLELDKVLKEIKNKNAKIVLLQFPEGLKQYSTTIVDYLKENTKDVEFFIWLESCFGACDTPVLPKSTEQKIDLVIQFGHNEMMPGY